MQRRKGIKMQRKKGADAQNHRTSKAKRCKGTRAQSTRCKAQNARNKAQGPRHKAQGARQKVQGARVGVVLQGQNSSSRLEKHFKVGTTPQGQCSTSKTVQKRFVQCCKIGEIPQDCHGTSSLVRYLKVDAVAQ